MSTNAALAETAARTPDGSLREVVEALAPIDRLAGSEGEHEAAQWLARRLRTVGLDARVEPEEYLDGFAGMLAGVSAAATASGLAALGRRGRLLGLVGGAAATALMVDDVSNGVRVLRRALAERKTTWNVVAEAGDPAAERTVVALAHHDAARTGLVFDQTLQRKLVDWFPGVIERIDTGLPQWWAACAGPGLVAAGAATRRRGVVAAGVALSGASTAMLADVARSPAVPGANDNLSGVAVLVALAESLRERPVAGVRVVLASCGAEEVMQGGIYGFAERHLRRLDRERTWVLNFESVGSPELAMLEGEGELVMEDYFDRGLRDLCNRVAVRDGIPMRRGMRARTSTDAVIPSRMGIATTCFVSLNRHKGISNYHQPDDLPENLSYPTVACAADLADAVVRELAAPGPG